MPRKLPLLLALLAMLCATPLHAQDAPPQAPDAPDTDADHALVGTWMGLTMDGEELDEGEFVLVFNANGTGSIGEGGGETESFKYTYDADTQECVLYLRGDEDDPFPIDVTFDGDTATFAPEGEEVLVARRVVEEEDGDDAEDTTQKRRVHAKDPAPEAELDHEPEDAPQPAEGESPVVGEWEGVSMNGQPVPAGESVTLKFYGDGSGGVYDAPFDEGDPFTWSYDATAEVCTIVDDGERMKFMVAFEDDTMTFESEDGDMILVMRRVAAEEDGDGEEDDDADDAADEAMDADGELGQAEAEYPEGPTGTWYVQKAEGEWVPAGDELRLEFRDDGTVQAFDNGEPEGERMTYAVQADRGVIQIFEGDGELEVELEYALFDDAMVLTFLVPGPVPGEGDPDDEEQMQMTLSRLPEGNAEHRRMRAGVSSAHPANGEGHRGRANRTVTVSRLRQLSIGVISYQLDHKDQSPDSIGATLVAQYIEGPEIVLLPWQQVEVPEGWDEMTDAEQLGWANENTGYAYVGAQAADAALNAGGGDGALLFELPLYEGTRRIAIAFSDGHVETRNYDEADELIEEQTGRGLMGWMELLEREQVAFEEAGDAAGGDVDAEESAHDAGGDADAADDAPGDEAPDVDADADGDLGQADEVYPEGVLGTWYAQKMQGDWVATHDEFRLEFRDSGTAHFFRNGVAEDEGIVYVVDEEQAVIRLSEPEFQLNFEMEYIQFDAVMILTIRPPEGLGQALEGEDMEIILSRLKAGNEDQQRERAAVMTEDERELMRGDDVAGDEDNWRPERLAIGDVRGLAISINDYHADHGGCPPTLGALCEYMGSADSFLQPGQEDSPPEGFDADGDEADAARTAWLDEHTGYAYIGAQAATFAVKNGGDDAVVVFALPLFEGMGTIAVGFSDGHAERMDYDEADELIEEQTGRDLMGWMEHLEREQVAIEEVGDADDDTTHNHADGAGHAAAGGGHFHADGTYHEGAAEDAAGADDHDHAEDDHDHDHAHEHEHDHD